MDLEPVLGEENGNDNFRPLKTIPVFSFHLLVSTLISFIGVGMAVVFPESQRCEAYFLMLYLRAIFWVVTLLFDHMIKYHHDKLRMNGFHDFHRATAVHKSVPFYLVSLWNTAIMAIQTLIQQYYGDDFGEHCIQSLFSPIVYVSIFSAVETGVLAVIHGTYISRVMRFNRARPLPDAMRGSFDSGSSVGLTQRNADVAELLEKQADLISFLQDHNLRLNQRLMQMNSEVRTITLPPS
ncbi:transmembrane protein 192 [Phlebotomus argentipes]|uniref:transmembrane protein 192 n=1 Tax=Phlebotomus argentipes TaxID=94469 RepID=UPI002892E0C1|nr:transmembrane protein 192 [Phlebotomus argentipes]